VALAKDRIKGRHIDGLQGWIWYERMRYRCHECQETYFPLDEELELGQSRMSLQKEGQLALLSVHMTYGEAEKVYEELTRNKTGRMTAHRTVQRWADKIYDLESPPLPESKGKEHVVGDGVMVPLREEGWKEAKVGAHYKVDEDREAQTIRYTATLGTREGFGQRLYELTNRPSLEKTAEIAFVSDAAEWLDGIQQMQFPLAERIVDVFHAEEYLWDVANAFYQKGTSQAREWAEGKVQQLREADQKGLQKSLAHMKPKNPEQKQALGDARRYFKNHGHKMDYPRYIERGLHIGSGIAEAACKHVIQSRFKRSGMRWSRSGAEKLLQLRVAYLNQQWGQVRECQKN
jgi:hypothetical protein